MWSRLGLDWGLGTEEVRTETETLAGTCGRTRDIVRIVCLQLDSSHLEYLIFLVFLAFNNI